MPKMNSPHPLAHDLEALAALHVEIAHWPPMAIEMAWHLYSMLIKTKPWLDIPSLPDAEFIDFCAWLGSASKTTHKINHNAKRK